VREIGIVSFPKAVPVKARTTAHPRTFLRPLARDRDAIPDAICCGRNLMMIVIAASTCVVKSVS
jgi:hypothetical protein